MARTTPELVAEIIEVDVDPDAGIDLATRLNPFIGYASELVTEVCAPVTRYSETRLRDIETWLAAHFYAVFDPQFMATTVGDVRTQYESKVDLGLDVTRYGQQAKRLDTEGGLAALDERMKSASEGGALPRKAKVVWLGRDC